MTDAFHAIAHGVSPLAAGLAAIALAALALLLLRRRAGLALALLALPGLATLALAVDLDATTEIPHLLRAVPFGQPGAHRFPTDAAQSLVWQGRACLGLQFVPALPSGPLVAEARLVVEAPDGRLLGERTLDPGAWRAAFGRGGDGGGVCLDVPERFVVGVDVRRGDPAFAGCEVRLVLAVPRHHIVCPERLRGTALAVAIPLLLGAGGAPLLRRRSQRGRRSGAGGP